MMRRSRLVVLMLSLALLVTGCGVMPTTPGEVRAGEIFEEATSDDVALLPNEPIPNSTPEQVVSDFMQAGISPAGDWSIARKFLSADADAWVPATEVLIDTSDRGITLVTDPNDVAGEISDSSVAVTVATTQVGSVDAAGVYTEVESEAVALTFELVKRDGEWRIKHAPDVVLIERALFSSTVYDQYSVMFWDPTFTYLVPDLRWYPRALAPTRIVRALLAGPTPALLPAVQNAFPSGARAAEGLTQVENRIASVALTEMQNPDRQSIARMLAQLQASLQAREVRLQIDGTPVDVVPAQAVGTSVDLRPLVLTAEGFGRLNAGKVSAISGFESQLAGLAPSAIDFAAGPGIAVVQDAGKQVFRVGANGQPMLLDARAGLVEPSIGPAGDIWSVPIGAPQELVVFTPSGAPASLSTTLTGITSVQAMQVSRDGTRLAVAATRDRDRAIGFVPIIRGADGIPTGLGEFVELHKLDGEAMDIAWLDDLTIGALVLGSDGAESLVDKVIGGVSESIPAPDGAVRIAGSNSAGTTMLLTGDGALYTRRVSQWSLTDAEDVFVLATQTGTGG